MENKLNSNLIDLYSTLQTLSKQSNRESELFDSTTTKQVITDSNLDFYVPIGTNKKTRVKSKKKKK